MVEAVLDWEEIGFLMEVFLTGHAVVSGGDAEGAILNGLELGGVCFGNVGEPAGAGVCEEGVR